jgi:hypothetical protein
MALLGSGNKDAAQAMAASSQYEDVRRPGKTAGAALKHYLTGSGGEMQDYDTALKASPGMGPPPFIPGDVTPAQALGRFLGATPKPDALQPPPPGQQPQAPEAPPDPTAAAAGLAPLPGMETMGAGAAAMQTQENDQNYHDQVALQAEARKATMEGLGKRERWGLSFAGGPETIIDPEQAHQAAIQDSQEKRDRLLAAAAGETNPETRAAMMREAELIGAQASNATRATVGNAAAQASSQAFKKEYGDTHDMTAGEKYAGLMRPRAGLNIEFDKYKTEQKRIQAQSGYEPTVQNILHKFGFEKAMEGQQQLADLFSMSDLATTDPAAATMLAGRYAKFSQGAGVLTDNDMKTFYLNIGGKYGMLDSNGNPDTTRINNLLRSYFTGTVDPQFAKNIETTLKGLGHTIDQRTSQIGGAIETRLRGMGADQDTIDSYLGAYAPNYAQHGPGTRGDRPPASPPGAPAPRPSAPAPQKSPPPEVVQQARQRAAQGEAKAKAWLSRWGL